MEYVVCQLKPRIVKPHKSISSRKKKETKFQHTTLDIGSITSRCSGNEQNSFFEGL